MVLSLALITFSGCEQEQIEDDTTEETTELDKIPSLGGTASARVVLPSDLTRETAQFFLAAPQIKDFSDNTLGIEDGDTWTETVPLIEEVTFTCSEDEDTFVFTASNADDTLRQSWRC